MPISWEIAKINPRETSSDLQRYLECSGVKISASSTRRRLVLASRKLIAGVGTRVFYNKIWLPVVKQL